jgi:hypothetical protein
VLLALAEVDSDQRNLQTLLARRIRTRREFGEAGEW